MKINNRYLIKTQNGFQKFLGIKKSDEHKGLRIVFDDGSEIKCTLTHRVQTSDGFVFAKNIKVQDVISGKTVKSIEPFYGDFFDPVEVENGNTYTCNEIEHHNCSIICIDETAWMASEKFQALLDSVLPAQGAMSWKKNVFISTPNGMNHFYDLVEGSRKRKIIYGLNKEQIEKLKETETILKETETSPGIFDVTIDKPSNNMALFEMDWREVPRFDSKGNRLDPEAFKEDIISKYGATYFAQNFSCVKGNTMIVLKDSLNNKDIEISIEEVYEILYE